MYWFICTTSYWFRCTNSNHIARYSYSLYTSCWVLNITSQSQDRLLLEVDSGKGILMVKSIFWWCTPHGSWEMVLTINKEIEQRQRGMREKSDDFTTNSMVNANDKWLNLIYLIITSIFQLKNKSFWCNRYFTWRPEEDILILTNEKEGVSQQG
jgi:hypothetical protein